MRSGGNRRHRKGRGRSSTILTPRKAQRLIQATKPDEDAVFAFDDEYEGDGEENWQVQSLDGIPISDHATKDAADLAAHALKVAYHTSYKVKKTWPLES